MWIVVCVCFVKCIRPRFNTDKLKESLVTMMIRQHKETKRKWITKEDIGIISTCSVSTSLYFHQEGSGILYTRAKHSINSLLQNPQDK